MLDVANKDHTFHVECAATNHHNHIIAYCIILLMFYYSCVEYGSMNEIIEQAQTKL